MALLNQYLDEAIQRCLELARVATDEAELAEDIGAHADALEDIAQDEADALHDAFGEAIAAIGSARERIAHEVDGAVSALTETTREGLAATSAVPKVLAAVREGAGRLQQLRTRLGEAIDMEIDAAGVAIQSLGEAGRACSLRLETGLETVTKAGSALGTIAGQAGDLIERQADAFTRNLAALSSTAMQATMDLIAAADATLMALGAQALDFGNRAIAHHNDAVHALRTGFTGEEPGEAPLPADEAWPGRALAPMGDAAGELSLLRDSTQEALRAASPGFAEQTGAARQKLLGIVAAVSGLFPLDGA